METLNLHGALPLRQVKKRKSKQGNEPVGKLDKFGKSCLRDEIGSLGAAGTGGAPASGTIPNGESNYRPRLRRDRERERERRMFLYIVEPSTRCLCFLS